MRSSRKLAITVLLLLASSALVAYAVGTVRIETPPGGAEATPDGLALEGDAGHLGTDAPSGTAPADAPVRHEPSRAEPSRAERNEEGAFVAPPPRQDYACLMPEVLIPEEPGCAAGEPYPACRWQLPEEDAASDLYRIWRNTVPEHRWAQPGLVSLVMAVARDHAHRWPGEILTIGDLDAPGPRHQTHDLGHDVDLYLENALMETNIGGGNYIDTYAGRPSPVVRMLRARVLDLAQNLATCSLGRLRIYYNDPEIIAPFLQWFGERGLVSDVGPAMVEHNRLHRFHFHMTVGDGLRPLPIAESE